MRRRLIEDQFADECSGVAVHGSAGVEDDEVDAEYGFGEFTEVCRRGLGSGLEAPAPQRFRPDDRRWWRRVLHRMAPCWTTRVDCLYIDGTSSHDCSRLCRRRLAGSDRFAVKTGASP